MTITLFGGLPLPKKIKRLLSKFGANAHLYLPGVSPSQGFIPGNYIDSAGTQPAVYDQPVGLVLDAAGSVGADVTGGLETPSNWSLFGGAIISGGELTLPVGDSIALNSVEAIAGRTYRFDFEVVSKTGNLFINVQAGTAAFGVGQSVGKKSVIIYAASSGQIKIWQDGGAVGAGVISNISVREVTGIHASQQTVGYKPIERRGIVNLLEYNAKFDDGAWWPSENLLRSPATVDGLPAVKMTPTTTSGVHRLLRGIPIQNGGKYTAAVIVKAAGYDYFGLKSGVVGADAPVFNLATGALAQGAGTIANLGGGRYLCCHTFTGNADQLWTSYWTTLTTGDFGAEVFAGDGVSGTHIFTGGLFAGTLTAAQILAAGGIPLTTTAPASSSAGNAYLEFDGVEDRLSLGGPLFQMADDQCVVVGVSRSDSASGTRSVVNVGNNSTGAVAMLLGFTGDNKPSAYWYDNAGTLAIVAGTTSYQNTSIVMSARKVGDIKQLRVNGALIGTSATAMGATLVENTYLGSAVSGGNFTGKAYPILAIKGTVSDADLAVLEKFVAQLSGVTL